MTDVGVGAGVGVGSVAGVGVGCAGVAVAGLTDDGATVGVVAGVLEQAVITITRATASAISGDLWLVEIIPPPSDLRDV